MDWGDSIPPETEREQEPDRDTGTIIEQSDTFTTTPKGPVGESHVTVELMRVPC